ncbi:ribulose-phosphate 3-epimerase [Alphaproteobacteria bacterium]|nr:ribulose-phosphate 3-epimerase [Alphaproteobacteria bacterium]
MNQSIRIAPSILAADFSKLGEEVTAVAEMGADLIHLDIMDGHFVPNISFGPDIIASIRKYTDLPFDVHLMIEPIDSYIEAFVAAGSDILTVHAEAGPHIHSTLQKIRALGIKAGVALNPGTPIEALDNLWDLVDLVLVMTVNPGFGGQSFIESQLLKVSALRKKINQLGHSVSLSVDGGINSETANKSVQAGANILVAGSSVFQLKGVPYSKAIEQLRNP